MPGRSVPGFQTQKAQIDAWQERRNSEECIMAWRFTTKDARENLKCQSYAC